MPDTIPVLGALSDVYAAGDLGAEIARWDALHRAFEEVYGTPAQFVARAPGRVNLIGE